MSHEIIEPSPEDRKEIREVINAAAELYEGVIPEESDTHHDRGYPNLDTLVEKDLVGK